MPGCDRLSGRVDEHMLAFDEHTLTCDKLVPAERGVGRGVGVGGECRRSFNQALLSNHLSEQQYTTPSEIDEHCLNKKFQLGYGVGDAGTLTSRCKLASDAW